MNVKSFIAVHPESLAVMINEFSAKHEIIDIRYAPVAVVDRGQTRIIEKALVMYNEH